jgi:hypothetical protein
MSTGFYIGTLVILAAVFLHPILEKAKKAKGTDM